MLLQVSCGGKSGLSGGVIPDISVT